MEKLYLIANVMPERSEAELDEALQRAIAQALSLGVTQVHDMGSFGDWAGLATCRRAHGKGSLPMRIYSFVGVVQKAPCGDSTLIY